MHLGESFDRFIECSKEFNALKRSPLRWQAAWLINGEVHTKRPTINGHVPGKYFILPRSLACSFLNHLVTHTVGYLVSWPPY